jgi:hypothetical protein
VLQRGCRDGGSTSVVLRVHHGVTCRGGCREEDSAVAPKRGASIAMPLAAWAARYTIVGVGVVTHASDLRASSDLDFLVMIRRRWLLWFFR